MPAALAAAATLALLAPASLAQENEDCLVCHEDPDLTGTRNGREISVHVDPETLARSVHADLDCVMCHMDLAGTEFGHDEDVEPVDCSLCHDVESGWYERSIHGRAKKKGDPLAPTCATCHGSHGIRRAGDPVAPTATMNVPFLCGSCHREGSPVTQTHDIPQEKILEHYSMSIHGEGLLRQGLTVTAVCTSCHNSHLILEHTDPASSINRRNIVRTCTRCHTAIERVHRKVIEGRLWETKPNVIPVCIDCHAPHEIRPPDYEVGAANRDCLSCHADRTLVTVNEKGETVSLFVDPDVYASSVHKDTACAQCHTEVQVNRARPCETIENRVDCSVCHAAVVDEFRNSTHGRRLAEGDPLAPDCATCHTKHAIRKPDDPLAPTYARNVPQLCARCHAAGKPVAERVVKAGLIPEGQSPDIVASYLGSIHGRALTDSGLVVTATCADCHGAHSELPPTDPRSPVARENIPGTCGKCHHGIEEQFRKSIHFLGEPTAEHPLPTCEDCHTSHQITRTDVQGFRLRMMNQCGRCHEKEAETFFDTFHGKVSRLGHEGAAKCYDCHGTHNILPPDDPDSTLSRANVVETCGQCHKGAHRQFAGYLTHATHHDPDKYPFLFWAFWGMTSLLIGTMAFAFTHTGAWLFRLWRSREEWLPHVRAGENSTQYVLRFTTKQRVMHGVMIVSFLTLAITGMTLKFSYTAWAKTISHVLGGFETTGSLHRIAALALLVLFFYHLFDLVRDKRERGVTWREFVFGPDSMMLTWRDAREMWGSFRWFLGLGPRPAYGRYTYWEKFDYFAVFWGVFVIGSTGLILWFPEFFTRFLPGWAVNVATIIHSDEALLAVAFIFTIHFFNTHFRPDKFPLDPVIFTGRVPLEEWKHDKPREYEELSERGELDRYLVGPFPRRKERALRMLGFVALFTGLTLIGLITYAMLFGYR
ncbi:MAG: hypothetical protein D6738_13270 [Acidobacteria bacterium]|nr:MAG: hypothetical protein D6738_13270 [Acidobacteriota bacterium]